MPEPRSRYTGREPIWVGLIWGVCLGVVLVGYVGLGILLGRIG
jgi:hypothetical protein